MSPRTPKVDLPVTESYFDMVGEPRTPDFPKLKGRSPLEVKSNLSVVDKTLRNGTRPGILESLQVRDWDSPNISSVLTRSSVTSLSSPDL